MTIWKFPFAIGDTVQLEMPAGSIVLSVQVQRGVPTFWAIVSPEAPLENRTFLVRGTGHSVDPDIVAHAKFIGTIQLAGGNLIFHVFDPRNIRR